MISPTMINERLIRDTARVLNNTHSEEAALLEARDLAVSIAYIGLGERALDDLIERNIRNDDRAGAQQVLHSEQLQHNLR